MGCPMWVRSPGNGSCRDQWSHDQLLWLRQWLSFSRKSRYHKVPIVVEFLALKDLQTCQITIRVLRKRFLEIPCSSGYVLHPAVFDGTIHSLGTASVGKNVNDLKIFGGVGRVSIIQTENFSQHEAWLEQMCLHSKPAS